MILLSGKLVAKKLKEEIKEEVALLKRVPRYIILLNEKDSSSLGYATSQVKLATSLGIKTEIRYIDGINVTYEEEIKKINEDDTFDACIITRPLLNVKDENKILSLLSYKKDVDAINPYALGKLFMSNSKYIVPATAEAVLYMLKYYDIGLDGKSCLVVGRSLSVGKSVAMLLLDQNATVTIAHSHTKNLKELLSKADIIVSALGKPLYLDTKDMKEEAICIDCGIHYLEDKIVGDVKRSKDIKMISMVPGGIGPITTCLLLKHVIKLMELKDE